MIKTLYRIFIGGLILSVTGCYLIMPDAEAEVPIPSVVTPPQPLPIAEPIPTPPNECQAKCDGKSGLKKKICLKKCDIEQKRARAKKVKPPEW